MNKKCFLFGQHDTPESVYPNLLEAIRCAAGDGVKEFIVGHYGSFDRMAARAARGIREEFPEIRFTLLLPYHPSEHLVELLPGFDGSFYPPGMETVPKRVAIVRANTYLVQHSDTMITYVKRSVGNSAKLLESAMAREQRGLLRITNLAK